MVVARAGPGIGPGPTLELTGSSRTRHRRHMGNHTTDVAVAICTRDRSVQLDRALRSIAELDDPPDAILVVDNAPGSEATRVLIGRSHPAVRYIHEPVPGLDFARNRALNEATQDVVAFLDDDAVADPSWLTAIRSVFEGDPSVVLCTGKVDPLTLETEGQRLFEANGGFARGSARISLPPSPRQRLRGLPAPLIAWAISVGSGCSLAVRRRPVLDLGGFDEALDLGATLPGGGDLDIIWRTARAGHTVVYEPAIGARHEHRESVRDTVNQILGHNQSLIVLLDKAVRVTRGRERLSVLAFLGWRLLKPVVRLGSKVLGRDPLPLTALLRLPVACWRGLGLYPRMQEEARARRERAGPPTPAGAPGA